MAAAPRKYQKTQVEYARAYGKSLATIKRWWKRGLPLDDPDRMGEFVSPKGKKPRETDTEFESPSIVPAGGDEPTPTATGETSKDEPSPVRLDEDFFKGTGFLAEIERLRKAARERAGAYFAAIANRLGPEKVKNRAAEWIIFLEALRKLEKDAPGIRKANDLTVDVAEIEAIWGMKMAAYRAAANNLPGRAAGKLTGRRLNYDDIVAVLEEEISDLFRALVDVAETDDEEDDAPAEGNPEAAAAS